MPHNNTDPMPPMGESCPASEVRAPMPINALGRRPANQSKFSMRCQIDSLFEKVAGLTIRSETAEAERNALRARVAELEAWIRDAQPLIKSGLRDPQVTTQEYAKHLDTRHKILFPK